MLIEIDGKKRKLMPANFNVCDDRLLVSRVSFAEQNEKGIFEPMNSKKEYFIMQVEELGPQIKDKEPNIVKGTFVMVRPQSGVAFKEEEKEYLVIRLAEVLCYVQEQYVTAFVTLEEN